MKNSARLENEEVDVVAVAPRGKPAWQMWLLWGLIALGIAKLYLDGQVTQALTYSVLSAFYLTVLSLLPATLTYHLDQNSLTVNYAWKHRRIPLLGTSAALSTARLRWRPFDWRIWGYNVGSYPLRLGSNTLLVQAVASRNCRGVLLDTPEQTFFLTPADPEAFLRKLARQGVRVTA